MSQQKPPAPPALVTLSPVADAAALREIDTTILPDGAGCYVLDTGKLCRLHKDATPALGLITPNSGPGAWQESIGDSLITVSTSPGAGVPGQINANSSSSATLAPTTPLLETDKIFGIAVADTGDTPGLPTDISVYGTVDTTTTPGTPRLRLIFANNSTGAVTVPDGLTYNALVWRATPVG